MQCSERGSNMDYYLAEKRDSFVGYDFSVMPLFKPATTYDVVRGRLMKFLSANHEQKVRNLVIYFGSCPLERITVLRDRIIAENTVADSRKKVEKDWDFFYESRSRRRSLVAASRMTNRWLLSGHVELEDLPISKKRMRIRAQKRNTRKCPG